MRKFPHLRQWNVALIFCASVRDSIDRLGAPVSSAPFLITGNLCSEQFWQAATDFVRDRRSVTGTHP